MKKYTFGSLIKNISISKEETPVPEKMYYLDLFSGILSVVSH